MNITLKKDHLKEIGQKQFEEFGFSEDKLRWSDSFTFDLSDLTKLKATKLRNILQEHTKLRGVPSALRDVNSWLALLEGDRVRCRHIKNFAPMLKQYLKDAPKHWVYERRQYSDVYQPYYVSDVSYHPPVKRDGWTSPAYVTMALHWEELGQNQQYTEHFHAEDCEDLTVAVALGEKGYLIESEEMLESYEENRRKYVKIHDKVGKQFLAVGVATNDVDGNARDDDEDRWYYRSRSLKEIVLEKDGEPAKVLVDVIRESDKKASSDRDKRPSGSFWSPEACDMEGKEGDNDDEIKPGDEDEEQAPQMEVPEVPLKPALVCFDLKRHLRLRVHVDQMTEYKYQTDLSEKLILPTEVRNLVNLLVEHKGGFKDIIGSKGGGAVILCAGPPGTGKTLTSEVYSEAMERPLYSVQCSQLGLTPEELEKELLKTFSRAVRWNAILLLDEADVYVAARGSNLEQNAIVGVFLRVLEYYQGVMFLTTNRADLVDDAIASRCLARIVYKVPTRDNQRRIWRTLADTAGIEMADAEIRKVSEEYPSLSGRDVKNLLKLASMVARASGEPITLRTIEFVKQFKPTVDVEDHN